VIVWRLPPKRAIDKDHREAVPIDVCILCRVVRFRQANFDGNHKMASKDNYQAEIDEARQQGVFALNPTWITTPIRMAAFAQAANAREAKEIAAEIDDAVKLGTHQVCTVGEFFGQMRSRKGKAIPR